MECSSSGTYVAERCFLSTKFMKNARDKTKKIRYATAGEAEANHPYVTDWEQVVPHILLN